MNQTIKSYQVLFIACHKSLRQYEFSDTFPTWIACRQNVNLTTTTTFVQN